MDEDRISDVDCVLSQAPLETKAMRDTVEMFPFLHPISLVVVGPSDKTCDSSF